MTSHVEPGLASADNAASANDERPRFSVIVPVYEQWHLVPALLDALGNQTFPADRFEVILVDNASPDFILPPRMAANVRLLRCETPGSYAARNHGARQARGDWFAFTDADCRPQPGWLAGLDAGIALHGPDLLIAGPVEVVGSSSAPGVCEIYDIVKGIPQERYVTRGYAATANLCVPTPVFAALDGFDGRRFSGGDADFCRRAGAAGYSLMLAPEARVEHPARSTWEEIVTKARRVKGGQIAAGRPTRRLLWLLRTMTPPVRGAWNFLRSHQHPMRHRLVAVLVLFRIWMAELVETVRLVTGQRPERR